jgi:hypothetical protein
MVFETLCVFNTLYILSIIIFYVCLRHRNLCLHTKYRQIVKWLFPGGVSRKSKKQIYEFLEKEPEEVFDESCIKTTTSVYTKESTKHD